MNIMRLVLIVGIVVISMSTPAWPRWYWDKNVTKTAIKDK